MKTTRVQIAKDYQKQIAKLEREQNKLYAKAIKTLKVPDTTNAFDWFYNDQQGFSTFLGGLND